MSRSSSFHRNFVTAACAAGVMHAAADTKPNILYIFADQWRGSATGYAGDPNVQTPHLDQLAAQGLIYKNVVSVCPVCTPHRASLMTGRFPTSTGMFLNDGYLPSEELCMAEIFKEAGYTTGYIGKWHIDGHGRESFIPPERRQGWEYWKANECSHVYTNSPYYSGTDTNKLYWDGYDAFAQTRDAQSYLTNHLSGGQPFILAISYGSPHFPHETAPAEYKALYPTNQLILPPNVPANQYVTTRNNMQGYYAHCSALDQCVGDLMATLDETGLATNTIVVFTSDHGETLGSHNNSPAKKQVPWDESARVPFLLRCPTGQAGQGLTVKTPLTTPDILPTLLGLAGIPVPGRIEGEDLSGTVTNPAFAQDRSALYMAVAPFANTSTNSREYRAIRTSRYTYVRDLNGPWLMYDDEADPYQMTNLVNDLNCAALQTELNGKLQAELDKRGDEFLDGQYYIDLWSFNVTNGASIHYSTYNNGVPTQSPISDYSLWVQSFAVSGGSAGDDDGDGLANVCEYGLGGNPTNGAVRGHVPAFTIGSNGFEYVYAKRRAANSGIRYTVKVTDSLVTPNWTTSGVEVTGSGVLDAEFNLVTNRISTGVKDTQFIRLTIE